jgi:hypothetical protein
MNISTKLNTRRFKQAWVGTIPLFVIILLFAAGLLLGFFWTVYFSISDLFPLWASLLISAVSAFVLFALFLNIPLPRKRKDPTFDLDHENKIAQGAWCSVYRKQSDPTRVVKQLFFCGWGHNDYRKHKALVIGKEKICGKWNPLILWFLHDYMILYQLIGLKRRLKFEDQIEALPNTYNVKYKRLRYEQTFVDHELTVENCPDDIVEQFKKLNTELEHSGLFLDDVHAGNVRITKEGRIRVVDGELYSGGEEWIKSKLVVLVNGEMVSDMEKVLGNNRIVAWVDHRVRVDEIVSSALKD